LRAAAPAGKMRGVSHRSAQTTHRVVIIGSGFGGLFAARRLGRADVPVTLIDRTNHHLFQPLLYQVATGILSEGEIAPPTRDVLRHHPRTEVILGEVTGIDLEARTVTSQALDVEVVTPYDSLIVAAGMYTSYLGHDEYAPHAPGLKTIDDALELRARIFGAFEMAEIEPDPVARAAWMTFVVIGGGATGVELIGQIAELAHRTLQRNFRRIDPAQARIVLVDAAPRLLGAFDAELAQAAARELEGLGVEIHLGVPVTGVDEYGVDLDSDDPRLARIDCRAKVWAAGVRPSSLCSLLADRDGRIELDRSGRVQVLPDCSLPGHPEVYVVGDMMALRDLPGVAEVAIQSGIHAAGEIMRRARGDDGPRPFRYHDLGSLASISRYYAVAELGPIRTAGRFGWLLWLVVHLTFLTGFKNRTATLFHWTVSFVGRDRTQRTFTRTQSLSRR
jgi:NADH dehydrogenase